jgi:hypothetical protein
MRHPTFSFCASSILLLCAFSSGCRDREVTSYRIPKEKALEMPAAMPAAGGAAAGPSASAAAPAAPAPSGPTGSAPMANTAVPTASGEGLSWTAPSHWVSKPASAMRKATYVANGDGGAVAELSITAFPGDVGGELANVNRWRGQIQLPPLSPAELATAMVRSEQNGLARAVVDFTGKGPDGGPQRVLGAMVPSAGATWFFKFTGPPALLTREKPAFDAFLKTIRVPAATP